jgi:hypothetical protein
MPGPPVLMIASVTLPLENQFQALGPVPPGTVFWATAAAAPGMVAAGQATVAPPGTPYPRPLPRSVRGQSGFGAAAANSSP